MKCGWYPLWNYTHYSLLKGYSKPKGLVKKCIDNNYKACGIADHKTLSGAVAFFQECKSAGIKPIIGCSFDGFALFAKNKKGWFDLIKIVSDPDNNIHDEADLIRINKSSINPIYYVNKKDANLHRIMLASGMKTTLPKIQNKILNSKEDFDNRVFFEKDDYFVADAEQSAKFNAEILETVYNDCEEYDILSKPVLPTFPTPNGQSEKEYLKELCRDGWRKILVKEGKVGDQEAKDSYHHRFLREFDVIDEAELFGYFLIVQDIIKFVTDSGWIAGPGRGSAAGCLISYMLGITKIDPIQYDLLFERFYNSGRNTGDHISLPDIDMDVPSNKRDEIIAYIEDKYGRNNVSQMVTFGRLRGKSALKEVLRIHEACGFGLMNEITKPLRNEADISDGLQEMDEDERSIIKWSLINEPEKFRDYCYIDDEGELRGDYAEYFKQAIDLEGTFKTQGKHAAGVVISKEPLDEVCPMVDPKGGGKKIAALEMDDLEALGNVKLDVLGLSTLDKFMKVEELINE